MVDDAWLVRKQSQYLQDAITAREISIQLLDCVAILSKKLIEEVGRTELAKHDDLRHIVERTEQLMHESTLITGTLLMQGTSPNEMLQQELGGLPNVDVTLPIERNWYLHG